MAKKDKQKPKKEKPKNQKTLPQTEEAIQKNPKKSLIGKVGIAILFVICFILGIKWWMLSSQVETTRNAFVRGPSVKISSKVTQRLSTVLVKPYQRVKKGQLLFELDDRSYKIEISKTKILAKDIETQLLTAKQQVDQANKNLNSLKKEIAISQEIYNKLQLKFKRIEKQTQKIKFMSDSDILKMQIEALNANQKVQALETKIAKQTVEVLKKEGEKEALQAKLTIAKHTMEDAQIKIEETKIHAPDNGFIGSFTVRANQNITANEVLATLFYDHDLWVEAYFSEKQLDELKIGQTATVYVQSYPGTALKSVVKQFSPASQRQMETQPERTATQSTLADQQFPVIVDILEPNPLQHALKPGMSAVVRVDVKTKSQ